jgi:hypothetical protein
VNSAFVKRIERLLGVSFPDKARVSLKKDGTIDIRSIDAIGTRYELSINADGDVFRSRFCSVLARKLNLTKKTAPEGMDSSRLYALNCNDYNRREQTIKDRGLLGYVRFLISLQTMFPGLQIP